MIYIDTHKLNTQKDNFNQLTHLSSKIKNISRRLKLDSTGRFKLNGTHDSIWVRDILGYANGNDLKQTSNSLYGSLPGASVHSEIKYYKDRRSRLSGSGTVSNLKFVKEFDY
mmetsp:Transcript_25155/g.22292  ORF Transcript_25155/g.22292 Transcript_25155/m.22292 type:complete len:112 (-) Transcript_25155:33-368(-)